MVSYLLSGDNTGSALELGIPFYTWKICGSVSSSLKNKDIPVKMVRFKDWGVRKAELKSADGLLRNGMCSTRAVLKISRPQDSQN